MIIKDNLRSTPRAFFVTFVLLVLGGLLLLTAIVAPNWIVGKVQVNQFHVGLWMTCYGSVCTAIQATGMHITVRTLCMSALLVTGESALASVAFIALEHWRKTLGYLVATGCLISSLLIGINLAVYPHYIAMTTDHALGHGWSFTLACLGCFSLFFASIPEFVVASRIQPTSRQNKIKIQLT